jgi:malonyl-CoA O-methyltransferase
MRSQSFLDKEKVARSFSRSAVTYDKHAGLQKRLAADLVRSIRSLGIDPHKILDVGTGTGEVAFLLHKIYKKSDIIGSDIAPGMIKRAGEKNRSGKISFEVADAESLPYPDGAFDLIASSTAYQWVENLNKAFSEASRVLKKGGYFAFVTMGPKTHTELRRSFKMIVDRNAEYFHKYSSTEKISSILKKSGFKVLSIRPEVIREKYKNFKDIFRKIKGLGAVNASKDLPKGLRGRSKMSELAGYYEENFRCGRGVYGSYEAIKAICVKT